MDPKRVVLKTEMLLPSCAKLRRLRALPRVRKSSTLTEEPKREHAKVDMQQPSLVFTRRLRVLPRCTKSITESAEPTRLNDLFLYPLVCAQILLRNQKRGA